MKTIDASTTPACPSNPTALANRLQAQIHAKTLDCVHCGLCLQSCPTYRATGRETSSPRGRIYLMRGHAEGRLDDPALLAEEAFLCLGCRACETACPSGVRYGEILEVTRAAVREQQPGGRFARALERFVLREIVPRRGRLAWVVRLLAVAKGLGLDRLAVRVLPEALARRAAMMPEIPAAAERKRMPAFTPAVGVRRGRVALFEGCVMPELFGRVNDAARLVLSRAGFDVVVPEAQGCCGALHAHAGDDERAKVLARANVEVFGEGATGASGKGDAGHGAERAVPGGFDAIVVTSAGCSAALKELPHWIGEDGKPLAGRVRDVLEFLDAEGLDIALSPMPRRVCYDDPCHLIHAQGIAAAPRNLLNAIPQLVLVPHRNPEACCGAAGIYNLTHPEMSETVLAPKLDALADAAPELVATANPGCAMQLAAGLAGRGIAARVVHPIELLEEASR